MKIALRNLIQRTDALDSHAPPLQRMAALYFSAYLRQEDTLIKIIDQFDSTAKDDEAELAVHAAMLLSQVSNWKGVEFLLELAISEPGKREMAVSALRNCGQFPFAALIAQIVDFGRADPRKTVLIELMKLPDDQLSSIVGDKEVLYQVIQNLDESVKTVIKLPNRPDSLFTCGAVVRRPFRAERNFQHTGFMVGEGTGGAMQLMPFDLGSIINRQDSHARFDIHRLLKRPGRRAAIICSIGDIPEVLHAYLLPFQEVHWRELGRMVLDCSKSAYEIGVGTVTHNDVKRYQWLTHNGLAEKSSYRPENFPKGRCVLTHPENGYCLETFLCFEQKDIGEIEEAFWENCQYPLAVYARWLENGALLATNDGRLLKVPKARPDLIFLIDEKNDGQYVAFTIVNHHPKKIEIAKVYESYIRHAQGAWGAVLGESTKDGKRRLIVADRGEQRAHRPISRKSITPGTLALLIKDDKDKDRRVWTQVIDGYLVKGGCSACFSTGSKLCDDCKGSGRMKCPTCDGTKRAPCGDCNDGQVYKDCFKCHGTRRCTCDDGKFIAGDKHYDCNGRGCPQCNYTGKFLVECKFCGGTGLCPRCNGHGGWLETCRTCNGTGEWNCRKCARDGTVECDSCNGSGLQPCNCSQNPVIQILPLEN